MKILLVPKNSETNETTQWLLEIRFTFVKFESYVFIELIGSEDKLITFVFRIFNKNRDIPNGAIFNHKDKR